MKISGFSLMSNPLIMKSKLDHVSNSAFTVCIKKCCWQGREQEKGKGHCKSLLNVNRVLFGGGVGKVLHLDCSI